MNDNFTFNMESAACRLKNICRLPLRPADVGGQIRRASEGGLMKGQQQERGFGGAPPSRSTKNSLLRAAEPSPGTAQTWLTGFLKGCARRENTGVKRVLRGCGHRHAPWT